MKNLSGFCILWAMVIAFACCKKENDLPSGSSGSVSFKYDSTKNFQSSFSGGIWEPNNRIMSIVAKGGKSIFVMSTLMPNGLKIGTYAFNYNSPSGMGTFFREDSTNVTEGYHSNIDVQTLGTLTITSLSADSLVSGTFTFVLKDPVSGKIKKLTAGVITNVKVVNNKTTTTGGSNTFSAKIDGVLWSPKQITGLKSSGMVTIIASDGTKTIGLYLIETIKTGTYQMDFGSDYHAQFLPTFSISNPESYVASSTTSKLTITEHNTATKQIKGTFNFKGDLFPFPGPKTYVITEGAFSVKY